MVVGVQQFFWECYLLPNLNFVLLVLLPKSDAAIWISNYRPITLANFFFKIVTKILVNKIGPIMDRVISLHQTTFIQGRHIHDSISLIFEGVNMLDKKAFGGNISIKLDISKAFDNFIGISCLRCFRGLVFKKDIWYSYFCYMIIFRLFIIK